MTNPDDEVPESFAKLIGHVCGVICIAFFALTLWILLNAKSLLNPAAVAVLSILVGITWFFGSTAHKLTTGATTALITPLGYWMLCIASALLAIGMALSVFNVPDTESFVASKVMLMLAGALALAHVSLYLYRHHIKKNH